MEKINQLKISMAVVMNSPFGLPEIEAEMQIQELGSLLMMVFAFDGVYSLGNMHNADWLKPRTLHPYLTYIPKNSTSEYV